MKRRIYYSEKWIRKNADRINWKSLSVERFCNLESESIIHEFVNFTPKNNLKRFELSLIRKNYSYDGDTRNTQKKN